MPPTIYDMRQTNLKQDPRGPTELLPLSTVELMYQEKFYNIFSLHLLSNEGNERLGTEFG